MKSLNTAKVYNFLSFMMALASSTIFTTYSIYYITRLGLNPLELVLVGTVLEVTVLLFEGITGVVADYYSRKWSVIIGAFVLGCGFLYEGSIVWLGAFDGSGSAVGWVLGAQVIFGIGWTFVSGANTAWMVDELGEEQAGAVLVRSKRYELMASLLGIPLSVALSTAASNAPYLAGGVMYLALGAVLVLTMRETKFVRPSRPARSSMFDGLKGMKDTWVSGLRTIRGNRLLILLTGVTLVTGAASEGYDRLWESLILRDIGFPASGLSPAGWFGMIAAAGTLLSLAAVWTAEKWVDSARMRLVTALLLGLAGIRVLALAGLAFAPGFGWALAAVLLIGTAQAVGEPYYNAWLNRNLQSANRATVLSMINQTDALGQSAGGPFVGWVAGRFSVRTGMLAAGLLLMPLLGVYGGVLARQRRQAAAGNGDGGESKTI
ncbi:MFS transporter [Paenibacillus sp. CN-4]|uniref:MFS transporter n=1 Tax=Paenibacillus nanchangensis TaxID=3348343 RepID=UPI00397896BD